MKPTKIEIECPECQATLTAEMLPGHPPRYGNPLRGDMGEPGEGPEIVDLAGCPHVDHLTASDVFYDALCVAAEESERDAWADEVDRRIDRERDREWDERPRRRAEEDI